jgi:26S proteasome regulatory subunit N2
MNPKVPTIRKQLQKTIADRHEDAMSKFGCALALGIIDAGGRNCTIGLQTQTGNLNMEAIVGMAVFTQYWYWFPLTHFLALAFTPTHITGVDADLEVPQFKFWSNTRPSMFDYPPEQEVKTEEAPEKVKTAVLSTTAQAKRRKLAKDRMMRRESMDVDGGVPGTPKADGGEGEKMDEEDGGNVIEAGKEGQKEEATVSTKRKMEKEKVGFELENMSRVLPGQIRYVSFPGEGRYQPVKKVCLLSLPLHCTTDLANLTLQPTGGPILLFDSTPDEEKSLLELKAKKKTSPPVIPTSSTAADAADDTEMVGAGGASAAAGVLTAVDEDVEGGEEAEVPEAFDVEDDGDEEMEG